MVARTICLAPFLFQKFLLVELEMKNLGEIKLKVLGVIMILQFASITAQNARHPRVPSPTIRYRVT